MSFSVGTENKRLSKELTNGTCPVKQENFTPEVSNIKLYLNPGCADYLNIILYFLS